MFSNPELSAYLETSPKIEINSLIYGEINMNDPDNISIIGNYRNRHGESIKATFDRTDSDAKYTGYTDSDIVVDGGIDEEDTPIAFASQQQKNKLYYSLEDCFKQFRPRSGINKAVFFNNSNRYLHFMSKHMMKRPRYYLADKNDVFKYWTSFRYEADINNINNIERGIANVNANNLSETEYRMDDTAPFIVYTNPVPINRIILKMQTHIGTFNLGSIYGQALQGQQADPFYDAPNDVINRTVPVNWKIQYLDPANNTWTDAKAFTSAKIEGTPYINADGYLELQYLDGTWSLAGDFDVNTPLFKDFNNPESNDILYIKGLRIVVNSMSKKGATFDLIELSPRLAVDFSDITTDYSIKKVAANLGTTGLPVGQLIASTGSITIGDYEQTLNKNNENSVIAPYVKRNVQFKFYEVINNTYYVPIKTLYADEFPDIDSKTRIAQVQLRDTFSYLESVIAPSLITNNVSLSYAICNMLDAIGFSNYIFRRSPNDPDPIISNFFVAPNTTVAQVLEDLAVSTQTAVFFDEDNNLVFMSKNYMIPGEGDRESDNADLVLRGSIDPANPTKLPNIIETANKEEVVFNSGKVVYDVRYIQKTYRELRQAFELSKKEQQWVYKPALLWQVSPTENVTPINNETGNQSKYALSAVPLNTNLSNLPPSISGTSVINNTIDLGEQVALLARYSGYLYAGQEIIRFDAIEYAVTRIGNVWISSAEEYQDYFAQIPFGGKMFPTGRVRIFTEYNYAEDGSTPISVARHGRGQFGTKIQSHAAGIDVSATSTHWTQVNVGAIDMQSKYLFGDSVDEIDKATLNANQNANVKDSDKKTAKTSLRQSLVRNRLASDYFTDSYPTNEQLKTWTNNVQSSALFFSGPSNLTRPHDFISYVYTKPFPNENSSNGSVPKHVGTRMRITGTVNPDGSMQSPSGAYPFTVIPPSTASSEAQSNNTKIDAASGGISLFTNPNNNNGYFFEIFALNEKNIEKFSSDLDILANVIFYKVVGGAGSTAIPVRLWSGRAQILTDTSGFSNINRTVAQQETVVYDLAVEYKDVVGGIEFYLYLNNQLIGIVQDSEKLVNKNSNIGLFVRGNSRIMFEKVYALKTTESANYVDSSEAIIAGGLTLNKETDDDQGFQSYKIPDAISSTYFSGLSPIAEPKYELYLEEFGTIMRECAYFNVRYDKAYPALMAQISRTFNKLKGYTVSGFTPTAYGAEFLVFNTSDSTIAFDERTSSWLTIVGVTFTQQSTNELTMDEYFNENSNLSDPAYFGGNADGNIVLNKQNYQKIKNSIAQYGRKEFTIQSPYIQNKDLAESIMKWMVEKVAINPRMSVGVKVFGTANLQLGDIVEFYYVDQAGIDQIAPQSKKFVVYSMDYSRNAAGLNSTVYVSEVR